MSLPVLVGLGDGLVVILGLLVALIVIIFAWWSTNVAETRVVGVIYLSTSHFNRLLQHLGQTPATATAAGHPTTFLAPSTDADTLNAVSQSRAVSDVGRDTASSAVAVKHDTTPSAPGECPPDQHVTARSTDDASEGDVTADVDAHTSGAHCHENCTDWGRLHATPDGMVLEGCTHLDSGVWWADERAVDTGASGAVVRHRRREPVNTTTNTQLDDTDVPYTCRCSASHVTQATRKDEESHQEESGEEDRVSLWGVGEGNKEMYNEGSGAERGSQSGVRGAEGGVAGVSEVMDSVGEVSILQNAVSDKDRVQGTSTSGESCDSPSFRTRRVLSAATGASMACSSDQQTDTAPERYNREPCEDRRCTKSATSEGYSTATDTAVVRTVLRARHTGHVVTVRLKYLDDQQRDVQTRLEDTVADFKRQHFAAELSANCTVRFVHNGQELRGDTATLRSFNVVDNSVIHCWLSRPVQPAPGSGSGTGSTTAVTAAATQLDFGCLVLPLFAMLLLLVWYCRFSYHVYFSAVSTFCLVAMTLVFAVCMFVSLQFGDDAIDEVAM